MCLRLFADISENTSVHIENMTVDSVRSMARKEYGRSSQFFRLEPSSCRSLGADETIKGMARAVGLTLSQRCSLRCSYITGTYTIALNVIFSIFGADIAGEHLESALGGSVCTDRFSAEFGHHRADIDNFSLTALHHLRQYSSTDDIWSHKVNVYQTHPP